MDIWNLHCFGLYVLKKFHQGKSGFLFDAFLLLSLSQRSNDLYNKHFCQQVEPHQDANLLPRKKLSTKKSIITSQKWHIIKTIAYLIQFPLIYNFSILKFCGFHRYNTDELTPRNLNQFTNILFEPVIFHIPKFQQFFSLKGSYKIKG